MNLAIIKERCDGCGACDLACAFGGIVTIAGTARFTDECTSCGACIEACPSGAIINNNATPVTPVPGEQPCAGVWIVADHDGHALLDVSFQLATKGRELATKRGTTTTAIVIGWTGDDAPLKDLGNHGADAVIVVKSPMLVDYHTELHVSILVDLVKNRGPDILLLPATARGRDYAPRVSKRLNTGLTADCTGLDIEDGTGALLQTRPTFGGNVMATIKTAGSRPQMATVRPGVFKASRCGGSAATIETIEHVACQEDCLARILRVVKKDRQHVDLERADIIITGGRGVGSAENFKLIDGLASALGGEVAGTRMACELGWIEKTRQVGQTGKTVSPKLYIACGVSGAIQHKVGIQGSDIIIAINKDPAAPIFDIAHYGIVGDLHEIIPAIVAEISRGQQNNAACDA